MFLARVEPELEPIKEMKPGGVDYDSGLRLLIRTEKDGRSKDALKTRNHTAIMGTIFGQVKEVEDLCGRTKLNDAGFLFRRKGGDPDGDQAALPEREAIPRMGGNLQGEPPIISAPLAAWSRRKAARSSNFMWNTSAMETESPGVQETISTSCPAAVYRASVPKQSV